MIWLIGLAFSGEPADYRADLIRGVTQRVDAMNRRGDHPGAIALAQAFQRQVEPAAPLAYEVALAHNRLGQTEAAMAQYGQVLALDPDHGAAHYDRGELHLKADALGEAIKDFEQAARLVPDHWAAHFRLAELAGRLGDAKGFEEHLTNAVRHGFDFGAVVTDPTWRGFARDPVLKTSMEKLIVLYGNEALLEAFQTPD